MAEANKPNTNTLTPGYVYGEDVLDKSANDAAVNTLYNAYFGRDANAAELKNWGAGGGLDTTVRALEDFLKKERTKFNYNEPIKTLDEIRAGTNIPPEQDNDGNDIPGTGAKPGSPGQPENPSPGVPDGTTDLVGTDLDHLVKFTTDPNGSEPGDASTVWLANPRDKKLTPFLSMDSLKKYLSLRGLTLENSPIEPASVDLLSNGLAYDSYSFDSHLPIGEDGKKPHDPSSATSGNEISEDQIMKLYGHEIDPEKAGEAFSRMRKIVNFFATSNSGISQEVADDVLAKDKIVALYTAALAFGDYDMDAIFADLRRRQEDKDGNASMQDMVVISDKQKAGAFYATPAGKAAKMNPLLAMPAELGGIDSSLFKFSVFNLPDEVYKILVPPVDWTTPEAQQEAEDIKSAYFDIMNEELEATTDREKAIADYNYQQFSEELNKVYGIKLSDNANQAWNQLEGLTSEFGQRGLQGSGFQNEGFDDFLKSVRRDDSQSRTEKLSQEQEAERLNLLNNASPTEIKSYIESIDQKLSDPSTSEQEKIRLQNMKDSLVPNQEKKDSLSVENLTAQLREAYPDMPDNYVSRMAQHYHDAVLDENGNYLSGIYENLYSNRSRNEVDKLDDQYSTLLRRYENKEKVAEREFSTSDPFSSLGYNDSSELTDPPSSQPETPDPVQPPVQPPASTFTQPSGLPDAGWELDPTTRRLRKKVTSPPAQPPASGITPKNLSNPWFGINTSESGKMSSTDDAKKWWKGQGYTGGWNN